MLCCVVLCYVRIFKREGFRFEFVNRKALASITPLCCGRKQYMQSCTTAQLRGGVGEEGKQSKKDKFT